MSKKLDTTIVRNTGNHIKERNGNGKADPVAGPSVDDLRKSYQQQMEGLLKEIDNGAVDTYNGMLQSGGTKGLSLSRVFMADLMQTSVTGKQLAEATKQPVNVPDITFGQDGKLQVSMEAYDPQDQKGQALERKEREDTGSYGTVALDYFKRGNSVMQAIDGIKDVKAGENPLKVVGSKLWEMNPVVNGIKTIQQGSKVHGERVKAAEELQGRVCAAIGQEKSSGAEF